MSKGHCHTGLDDRCRDLDGEIRQKRGDTLVGTLRETYRPDFAPSGAATCASTHCASARTRRCRKSPKASEQFGHDRLPD